MSLFSDVPGGPRSTEVPEAFASAAAEFQDAAVRPEVTVESMPAPQRIAPFASALSGEVELDEDEFATGRLILLHDPQGNDAWNGTFRLVAYVRAQVDPELAVDPLLGQVGWSWLTEALEAHGAAYAEASGTVTRVITETFGGMEDDEPSTQIEIRASWTPQGDEDGTPVRAHVDAWGELLCTAAGLPPVQEGVTAIPSRRGQRSH